jgi:RNA polymerase sigma-70 factor (ECF subfamily)
MDRKYPEASRALPAAEFDALLQGLLRECAGSDAGALEQLYRIVAPILFASITRILRYRPVAEDVLQEVFVSIWQRAEQYDPTRGRPVTWMMTIARNRAIDELRSERATPVLIESEEDDKETSSVWLAGGELLNRCMNLLPGQQRHYLELAYVTGASHQEIAYITGSPLGTVKSGIRRALLRLRRCLES